MLDRLSTRTTGPPNPDCGGGIQAVDAGTPLPRDHVAYRSRGTVLVIGDSGHAAEAARELARRAPKLRITLFAPGADGLDFPANVSAVSASIAALRGHLGGFSADVRVAPDRVEDAGLFSSNPDRTFDLVLDLSRVPLVPRALPPPGYHAPGHDRAALARALDRLPRQVGAFHKPRHIEYRADLCAHAARDVAGCTRCLDSCDALALRSLGDRIELDPYLCQGCATCTLACPTGALAFTHPTVEALESVLRRSLAASFADAAGRILLVHEPRSRVALSALDDSRILHLEVEPVLAFPEMAWVTALVLGARAVIVVVPFVMSPSGRGVIDRTIGEMRAILAGLDVDPNRLQIVPLESARAAIAAIDAAGRPSLPSGPMETSRTHAKRVGLLERLDLVRRNARMSGQQTGAGVAVVPLDAAAAFGNVVVDAAKCTTCFTCVSLCPTDALVGEPESPSVLKFRESRCVQCDLCRAGCPEQAIRLEPRFVTDAVARGAAREIARGRRVPGVADGAQSQAGAPGQ